MGEIPELKELYQRNINVTVERLDDKHIVIHSSLLDLDHSIRFSMEIHAASRTIVSGWAQMVRVPFRKCRETLHLAEGIAGLVIERGITRNLANVLGHNTGCMHLVELAVTAARMAAGVLAELSGGLVNREKFEALSEQERIDLGMPFLQNTCLVFKVDGD
ncbi:MAG: DUF2889 domain-containing protein [Chloroflexia bacterium]|nr:DUF2889 domain-containing protein [Chloroflexia bacterium]